ncbi:MAG: tetratricopeptide repeat protein, partial [Pirellulaceae bacterium]|nr:tetratricopeptide repeat protein [Pirellulaceae bacterium]
MNPSPKLIGTSPPEETDRWADESLSAHAEGQWQRLRRQVELGSGFWLAFLFSRSPRIARVFAARLAGVYRSHVNRLLVLRAETPDQLPTILQRLGIADADPADAIWVRAEQGYTAAERAAWRRAWETFFLRLNEHRDQLRRQWNGALIFELPAELKPIVRDAAPDLWSIRAIVLEPVEPGTRETTAALGQSNDQPPADQQLTDPLPEPLGARVRRSAAGEPEAWERDVQTRLREIGGWMTGEQSAKAVEAARETVEILESHDAAHPLLSDALMALAEAEQADGDDAAALDHYRRLFSLNAANDDRSLLEHLEAAARSAANVGRPDLVRSFADRQEQIARHRVQQYGENAQTLRDLSISLNNVGDMRRESGDLAGTEAAFAESLEIDRRLHEQYGESPQTLRDLSVSLDNWGRSRFDSGDLAGAEVAFTESLEIRRRLRQQYGESP